MTTSQPHSTEALVAAAIEFERMFAGHTASLTTRERELIIVALVENHESRVAR